MNKLFLTLIALLCLSVVYADSVSYCNNIPLTQLIWSSNLTLPKFNSSLGSLTSVSLNLSAFMVSNISEENLGPTPTYINVTVTGNVTFLTLENTELITNISFGKFWPSIPSFDGIFDFSGTSGRSENVNGSNSLLYSGINSNYIAGFSGENFNLIVNASSAWTVVSSGNHVDKVMTKASASACVNYTYSQWPNLTVTLLAPANNSVLNYSNVHFFFNISAPASVSPVSSRLFIDNNLVNSSSALFGQNSMFYNIGNGTHLWYVSVLDSLGRTVNSNVWNLTINLPAPCVPNWHCNSWDSCSDGYQRRTCTDLNSCNSNSGKPSEKRCCASGSESQQNQTCLDCNKTIKHVTNDVVEPVENKESNAFNFNILIYLLAGLTTLALILILLVLAGRKN